MKPSIAVSGSSSGVSEISGGASGDRTEQAARKPVRGIYVLCSIVGYDHSEMHSVIDKTIKGIVMGWEPDAQGSISLLCSVQASDEAQLARCPVGTGALPLRMKLTTQLHLVARSRMVKLYIHSPICFHGMMLN
jgi:hypothetical protein